MPLSEAILLALNSIWVQKLKSFFSLIGVLIGVTFLVAVVSIVQGMNVYVTETVTSSIFGVNTFQLRSRANFTPGEVTEAMWRQWSRNPRITVDDVEYLRSRIRTPVTLSREGYNSLSVGYRGRTTGGITIHTVDANFFDIKNWKIAEGRSFSPQEVDMGAEVVVLGWDLAEGLFEGRDPLGKSISIGGLPHRVVGVVERQGTVFGMSMDKFAVTPITSSVRRLANRPRIIDALHVQAADVPTLREAQEEVASLMRVRRGLKPNDLDNFAIETAEGALSEWDKIATILFMALPGLVGISLVVGGIVIMNIMLMSVTERTREIGIRKALGARRKDILRQFVVEAATLSVAGAALGVGTGILLAYTVRMFTPLPAAVAPWSVGLAVTLGLIVGIIAGVQPARQAARLDPIAALRQE